ncbi:MAG: LacI family transcriptional regulator [Planctomycetes bacterium]|nr:LacI family transcriptional regulator [Planctomycetota bacterium]
MVTLKDIAEALNVSIPQVSKVLNHSHSTVGVSAETARRIRQAAEAMGYVRNRTAAALRTGRHNTIGVLIQPWGAVGSGLTEALLTGIAEETALRDQHIELRFYRGQDEFHRALARINGAAIDGLIVAGVRNSECADALERVVADGLPVVTVHIEAVGTLPNMQCNEREVGRLATEHLIEQGCTSIAHIRFTPRRYEGYVDALRNAGLPLREALVYGTPHRLEVNVENGQRATERFLACGVAFDGIVAESDFFAMGAMVKLIQEGLCVPDDVKIIGVDDSPICLCGPVPLSSVSLDVPARARLAVRKLLDAVAGEAVQSITCTPALVVRRSSGG